MKKYLLFLLLPFNVSAQDFYVQDNLADMVEDVIRTTNLKINIPDMAAKYVRINQVDGIDVCAPEAKEKVLTLQTAFNKHPNMFRTKSHHGVYSRQANGKVIYTPSSQVSEQVDQQSCDAIIVSVR